jgi:branched-chain amino acid transport system permease protein
VQFLLNTIINAAMYVQLGLSFGFIFYCGRFFHLAHGAVFLVGAYVGLLVTQFFAIGSRAAAPAWVYFAAGVLGAVVAAGAGGAIEILVYRPLRRKHASSLLLLLASYGVLVSIQSSLDLLFGSQSQSLRTGPVREGFWVFGGAITAIQLLNVGMALAVAGSVGLFLRFSMLGRQMLATADSARLAELMGIDTERTAFLSMVIGSALVGGCSVPVALETNVYPALGFSLLLKGVVATIIGGIGSLWGPMLGGLLLALAENSALLLMPSSYRDAVAFAVLIVFLVLRPDGLVNVKLAREA